jgi:hypothetical protein
LAIVVSDPIQSLPEIVSQFLNGAIGTLAVVEEVHRGTQEPIQVTERAPAGTWALKLKAI